MVTLQLAGANGYVSKGLGPSEIYSAVMRVNPQPRPAAHHSYTGGAFQKKREH